MATTTNYGWTTPDDTALVKDGAAAIRSLGTAIDTSMNTALGTKKAGLVLLNTTSFSAVSSTSFPAFTNSAYDAYKIVAYLNGSTGLNLLMRLRASGTDITSANYDYSQNGINFSTAAGINANAASATSFQISSAGNSAGIVEFTIYNLASAAQKSYSGTWSNINGGGWCVGRFNTTTTADSLSLITSTGTITGSMSVYGFNK